MLERGSRTITPTSSVVHCRCLEQAGGFSSARLLFLARHARVCVSAHAPQPAAAFPDGPAAEPPVPPTGAALEGLACLCEQTPLLKTSIQATAWGSPTTTCRDVPTKGQSLHSEEEEAAFLLQMLTALETPPLEKVKGQADGD